MDAEKLFHRYRELQQYVGWTADDATRVHAVADLLRTRLPAMVDDFYAEIERHPDAMKVITGGQQQIVRLKGTLLKWLQELLAGPYESDYVARRWKVGWRHVEIGLDQVYTNVALSRLRKGLLAALDEHWTSEAAELLAVRRSLHTLMDLDLAIIEDAYQAEFLARQQRAEQHETIGRIAGSAPCMFVVLSCKHTILYFSPFAVDLTGYSAEEVLGKEFYSVFLPDPVLREAMVQQTNAGLGGVASRGFESPIQCKDRSKRWMVWNVQLLPNYGGEPTVLAVGQDITSLKQAQEQALQSERLAAIGQMMTGLAHESGNALNDRA